ncbi:MAG: (2Fe-2S)-binding protein [Paraclostridium bifermentans]|uniref:(2Fe-2S)-binding protein n=1 Tax=Paraclostridium bifermentans TaxID=1490 RepID=UPI00241CDA5C|nr:(2Fe-2S)-binding protein [Paraclostridium bifermentans]MBS5953775.1 (2Fe-2S)-binding protein [Paraclostridium bifermentans]
MDKNQLVCGCMKVTLGDIENSIKSGAKSFEEVQNITNVSRGCGRCSNSVKELISKLLEK